MPETQIQPPPFQNSYWVIPGKLMAGEYPLGRINDETSEMRLEALLASGIRTLIDLTRMGDSPPYRNLLMKVAEDMVIEVDYLNFPIKDFTVPSSKTITQILEAINASLKINRPVYVHCQGGVGRTGTIVGCFLVSQGMTGMEALEQLNYLRRNTLDWWYPSPESTEQRKMVENWKNH